MASVQAIFDWYKAHLGMPYDAGPLRLEPSHNGTDCSGAVTRALRSTHVDPGANDTSERLEIWARSAGGRAISVTDAIRTPGAGLFIWGTGPDGHVAMSRGDGTTYETPAWGRWGHALGIGNASAHRWTGAVLWPAVNYSGHTGTPTTAPPLTRLLRPGTAGQDVHAAQVRLVHWAAVTGNGTMLPGPLDGIYGPHTEHAVRVFQQWARIGIDGIVGPQTWAHLWAA